MEQASDCLLTGSSKLAHGKVSQRNGIAWGIPIGSSFHVGSSDASLFSSSLPVFPHEKLNFADTDRQAIDDSSSNLNKLHEDANGDNSADTNSHAIGNLLPDDEDDLLAGLMDDFDLTELPTQLEDLEEYDLFRSGGGMELDFDPQESLSVGLAKTSIIDGYNVNGTNQYTLPNGVGTVVGEHPYGEHPSRTLFVRNINSNVEDSELRSLFEQHGDIRTLYTACKHRGFVMISYYDIRDARNAMRALQNKPLRRRKLDIHFSIPKDNPSDKDINQGTLVVFNLDPSVSNDDLRQIFGAYGEVKEIRETPHKRHHKFIEFFDVRAAEAALRSLNRSDIAGKRIKLEPSRPGGARRTLMQQLNQDLDQDDGRSYPPQVGSPITSSPPGAWAHLSSPVENSPLQTLGHSPGLGAMNLMPGKNVSGLASILPPLAPHPVKIAPIGKDQGNNSSVDQIFSSNSTHSSSFLHPHSLPEHSSRMMPNMSMSPGTVSSFGASTNSPSVGTLSGSQFLWGGTAPYSEHTRSSPWATPSAGHHAFVSNGLSQNYAYSTPHGSFVGSGHHHQHHVGSAPSGLPFEKHFSYYPESPETSFTSPLAFGGMGLNHNGNFMMKMGARTSINHGVLSGSISENNSPNFRVLHPQRMSPMFLGGGPFPGPVDGLLEHGRSRKIENGNIDNKKQYQLDLDKIISGEDTRTTLMIKNIPNKYTSKMLLGAIDENHKGTYDFLYLPIDFKNKCNVGYAFINMISPSHIISFYQAFNGKKWEKFNSEKVASLAYARIQGKAALVAHFQNSSLMNEDKRCRPILFNSEGSETGEQGLFLPNTLSIRSVQLDTSFSGESLETAPSSASANTEKGTSRLGIILSEG